MELPDDEIRRRILTKLDEQYEKEFEVPVSVDDLASELNLDRPALDRHLSGLRGRGFIETSLNHYAHFTPSGKDEWDRIKGKQYHMLVRRQILESVKQVDDKEPGGLTTSDALASDLGVNLNTIFINLLALKERGWVKLQRMLAGNVPFAYVSLTPEGRVAAETPPVDINLCFVLMPFEPVFDPVYEAIKASAEAAHMRCERADKVRDNQAIIEKIKRSIQRAGLIVADLTGNNPNVFCEVGYAHGLGKAVILITQAQSETVPLDLRHLEHIKYSTNRQGLTTLTRALTETIVRVRSREI